MTTTHQENEEKFKGELYKAVFQHWIIQDFCRQYDINFKIVEDLHQFDGLIFCPIDLPIHTSVFLENFSSWIATGYGKNCANFYSFGMNNPALSDSMIEHRTLMLFQVKRKLINREYLLSEFEKNKKKLKDFLSKHQQSFIKKVIFFLVSSGQVESNEKMDVLPSFVDKIPFEFGGILHIPLWLYLGDFPNPDSVPVKNLIAPLFINTRSNLFSLRGFQLQANEFKKEREEVERQREELVPEKEEVKQEREEAQKKIDTEIDALRIDVNRLFQLSDALKKQIECLQHAQQSHIPVDHLHHIPQTQAHALQNTGNLTSQTQRSSLFPLQSNQLQTPLQSLSELASLGLTLASQMTN